MNESRVSSKLPRVGVKFDDVGLGDNMIYNFKKNNFTLKYAMSCSASFNKMFH